MAAHSKIPPSSAYIWGDPDGCTGWADMAQLFPDNSDSPESMEGNAAHEIGETLIEAFAREEQLTWEDFEGKLSAQGLPYTHDMYLGAAMYAAHVCKHIKESGVVDTKHLGTETKVHAPNIHIESWGTTDAWLFNMRLPRPVLHIWDFKFGRVVVEHVGNRQGVNYAAGLFQKLGIDGHNDDDIDVHIHIVQPRAFHREGTTRTWKMRGSDLRGYFNQLRYGAEKSLNGTGELRAGKHCKYCQSRINCEAFLRRGPALYNETLKPVPVVMSPVQMGAMLTQVREAQDHFKALSKALEAQVEASFDNKVAVPGYQQVSTMSRRKWDVPVVDVKAGIALLDMMQGTNHLEKLVKEEELITPKQAMDLGIDEAVIKSYSSQRRTGAKIVPVDAKQISQIFNKGN